MQGPLISIIIPVRNAQSTISRAIDSVLGQSYIHRELIVIDGLSDDGTIEAIKSYGDRIRFFASEKDSGVYQAINRGIAQAKGDWIYILGADDYMATPEVLSEVFAAIDPQAEIIYGDVVNEDVTHRLVPAKHTNSFGHTLVWRNTLHQQGVFYHRTIFSSIHFDESLRVLADYDLHLWLRSKKTGAQYVPLLIARCHAQGLSKQFRWKLYREELTIKKKAAWDFFVCTQHSCCVVQIRSKEVGQLIRIGAGSAGHSQSTCVGHLPGNAAW